MRELFNDFGAEFSECRKYRYALWRIWDRSKPFVMFIGLNPSTANESEPDPTITRVVNFAKRWGYGGVYMMNCFAYVSTNPKQLYDCGKYSENREWLLRVAGQCKEVVFAWGDFKIVKDELMDEEMTRLFPKAKALFINKNGSPRHPLYVKGDVQLIQFN